MTQYGGTLDKNSDGVYDGEFALYVTLVNYVLSAVFVLELAISLFAHWWRPFFTSGWKMFDLVIVVFSLVTVVPMSPIPTEIARAMRVFRVFGTAQSLRRIVNPLLASIIPVINAFVIVFVVMAFGQNRPPPPLSSALVQLEIATRSLRHRHAQRAVWSEPRTETATRGSISSTQSR
jgi:hypothetical protein